MHPTTLLLLHATLLLLHPTTLLLLHATLLHPNTLMLLHATLLRHILMHTTMLHTTKPGGARRVHSGPCFPCFRARTGKKVKQSFDPKYPRKISWGDSKSWRALSWKLPHFLSFGAMNNAPPHTPERPRPTQQTWVSPGASRPLERALRGKSKVRALLRQIGHMVQNNMALLKEGFSDYDFYDVYMNEPDLPRTTTCLPWGWTGLVPIMQDGKWRYKNAKGGTFHGICPLKRLGPMRYAFTDDAWEAMQTVLREQNTLQIQEEKKTLMAVLRNKRKRNTHDTIQHKRTCLLTTKERY